MLPQRSLSELAAFEAHLSDDIKKFVEMVNIVRKWRKQ